MKDSGDTWPRDCRWMRSSPMAAAASPDSTSPGSSSLRGWAKWPQIPAKQSAWSSMHGEGVAPRLARAAALLRHLLRDWDLVLNVMADL